MPEIGGESVHKSFHSCEGRNLRAEGGNCTITRRFVAAEIPAFAGMAIFVFGGN
ncbi:MAG: hypothetical protein ACR2QC_06165 [Gammaproteobacteria bacterium]